MCCALFRACPLVCRAGASSFAISSPHFVRACFFSRNGVPPQFTEHRACGAQVRYKVFCYLDAQHSVPAPSYWIRGQQGRLAVHLTGWPPARIEWLKEGLTISPLDGRLRFEDHLNVSKAALVVQTASDADRGNYSCLARNGYDADRFDVYVRVRHKYAFVVPLSGIAIQVFVLLAIIGASELRRRRPGHKRDRKNRGATAQGASVDGIRGAT
ncbi:zwei Ig domain protein zig-1-like [Haemaphysalis longicornis]